MNLKITDSKQKKMQVMILIIKNVTKVLRDKC